MSFNADKLTRSWNTWRDTVLPRFLFNINPRNLWYNVPNPYDVPNLRGARDDITHSYVDLFVEGWRELAYLMGHVVAIALPAGVVIWLIL